MSKKITIELTVKQAEELISLLSQQLGKTKIRDYAHLNDISNKKNIHILRKAASELGILSKSRKHEAMKLQCAFCYLLKGKYLTRVLGEALGKDHSTIVYHQKKYEDLKHYPDYMEASATVIRCLIRYSLVDSPL